MIKINKISYLVILLGCVSSLASVSDAQDYERQRKAAMSEIRQFFNKQFVVTGTPVRSFGPERLSDVPWLDGKKEVFRFSWKRTFEDLYKLQSPLS